MFKNIKNIAVINLGFIGDVVISSCVTLALKNHYPDARITYITVPRSRHIAPYVDGVDEVVIFDKDDKQKALKMLPWSLNFKKNHKIDIAVVLNETFRSGFLANLIGARYRLGHNSEGRGIVLTHSVPWLEEEKQLQNYIGKTYMRNLEPLNIAFDEFDMGLSYSDEAKKSVMDKIYQLGGREKFIVGLCPCAGFANKDWVPEEAVKAINFINSHYKNRKVVIIGVEAAREFADKLRALGCNDFIDMTCKTSIPELIALISNFEMFITADSSPMHMGIAQKIPTIGIFRQENDKKWWPDFYQKGQLIKDIDAKKIIEIYKSLYNDIYGD